MPNNWNNTFYEKLITAFCEKANVDCDAALIHEVLNKVYGTCYLPNVRTFERFLTCETKTPRESTLGFMCAYILDIPQIEVERADFENLLIQYFYKFMKELLDTPTTKISEIPIRNMKIDLLHH